MIVLDTNVVSELMRPAPASVVLDWFAGLADTPLALTAISVAELRYGVAALPKGRRRSGLNAALDAILAEEFAGLVLPFDGAAASVYGTLAAAYRAAGIAAGQSDTMIAATALCHAAPLATRNTRDFRHSGLTLIDPFTA